MNIYTIHVRCRSPITSGSNEYKEEIEEILDYPDSIKIVTVYTITRNLFTVYRFSGFSLSPLAEDSGNVSIVMICNCMYPDNVIIGEMKSIFNKIHATTRVDDLKSIVGSVYNYHRGSIICRICRWWCSFF